MARPLCVDISQYQGLNINWPAYITWAKQWDGVARIIMRSSYGTGGLRDDDFEAYWSGAVAAGCSVIGVYHYAYPNYNKGAQGAINEADSQFAIVGNRLRDNDFLILDWEEETPEATPDWAYTWLARQRSNYRGRLPNIYVTPTFAAAHCQDSRLAQFPLILAYWTFDPTSLPPAPKPWTTYAYLQWSNAGTVPGIPGQVNMDVFQDQGTASALSMATANATTSAAANTSPVPNSGATAMMSALPTTSAPPTMSAPGGFAGAMSNTAKMTTSAATSAFAGIGGDGMALIQNPANAMRLDLVYVGADGNLWHNWNNNDGLQGLIKGDPSRSESWGNPGTKFAPLTAAATWDTQGINLNVVAATPDGALWAQARQISGMAASDWVRVTGQAVALTTSGAGTSGSASPSAPAYDDTAIKARLNTLEAFVAKIKTLFAQ